MLYFIMSVAIDVSSSLSRRANLHRDRLFAICAPLSLMVALLFACVVIPFTPR